MRKGNCYFCASDRSCDVHVTTLPSDRSCDVHVTTLPRGCHVNRGRESGCTYYPVCTHTLCILHRHSGARCVYPLSTCAVVCLSKQLIATAYIPSVGNLCIVYWHAEDMLKAFLLQCGGLCVSSLTSVR